MGKVSQVKDAYMEDDGAVTVIARDGGRKGVARR